MELRVLTTDATGPNRSDHLKTVSFPVRFPEGYDVYYCRWTVRADYSPTLLGLLGDSVKWADLVHLTAAYSIPTIPALNACRRVGRPVVWSPRGAFQNWTGSKKQLPKLLWDKFCRSRLVPNRSLIHAASIAEAVGIGRRYPGLEVAVVPNGVDISPDDSSRDWTTGGRVRLLYLGRLDPIKGIENLLRALSQLPDHYELDIHGTGETDYAASLRALAENLGVSGRARFHGHLDDAGKLAVFMAHDVCVVPSHSESFGMVVAESLAHGVPVLAGRGVPWPGLEEHGCGWLTDNSGEALAKSLRSLPLDRLPAMGLTGRNWMEKELSWNAVGEKMMAAYETLIERSPARE